MASNNKAKDLLTLLNNNFINKKILLLDVNSEWIKYDIVIYTPSVCMGVSFDVKNYFDAIFAFGCHESLGA